MKSHLFSCSVITEQVGDLISSVSNVELKVLEDIFVMKSAGILSICCYEFVTYVYHYIKTPVNAPLPFNELF